VEAFSAHWSHLRVPSGHYRVHSALLRWDQRLARMPERERSWHEATVIAGTEWRQLATNLVAELAPKTNGHGVFYAAFLADRLLYRDAEGNVRLASATELPQNVVIEHRFPIDETLEHIARVVDSHLAQLHPGDTMFVLMAPNAKRFTQPLLVDRQTHRCVFISPAALYDTSERAFNLATTADGLSALFIEGHGVALLKNPVSSAARLADLGLQTVVRFMRLPLPKPGNPPPLAHRPEMDLAAWEHWLDLYTGTRREQGTMQLLIDGDPFFARLHEAIADATNHLRFDVYIFDKDDIGVGVADQLKERSAEVQVQVIFDRLGSLGAGTTPPATPLPDDFVGPSSILPYLRKGSDVHVRPFLNPWFSSDHSKVLLADGSRAWLGGMNLGREYRYEWHDMMVELEGPIVESLETEFKREWAHEGPLGDLAYVAELIAGPRYRDPLTGVEVSSDETPAADPPLPKSVRGLADPPQAGSAARRQHEGLVPAFHIATIQPQIITPNPVPPQLRLLPTKTLWKPFASAVLGSLRKAQKYVYVENPYLFDKRVILGLVKARNRGVDVRVVLPCVNDFKAGGRSNLVIANYLYEHGVRVYFYPGMTHVKALLVDGWACTGSANLNHLSLRINHEQNVATSDPAFATRLKQDLFDADFARSYELTAPISVDWVDFLTDLALEGF
jgi:phosphatidylserine/phosphatidylglycerophosphate/cardiolipin synthase-like enzyme